MQIPPQPTLPIEKPYTEAELAFIEEQPAIFPTNQDSNWGLLRRVFTDEIQMAVDELDIAWQNRFVQTALEYLALWEAELGLPIEPPRSIQERRTAALARRKKGLFTYDKRTQLIESYIGATFGVAPSLQNPLTLDAEGITLSSDVTGTPTDFYSINEFIEEFRYQVIIDEALDIDFQGLTRELDRITPAGINWSFDQDIFKLFGAISPASGGFAKVLEGTEAKTLGAITPMSGGFVKVLENPLASPVKLAWFYKPPSDGTTAATLAARMNEIILTHRDESFLTTLRGTSWGSRDVWQYIAGAWVRGAENKQGSTATCSGGDFNIQVLGNQMMWFDGDFCTYMVAQHNYFARNGANAKLYTDAGDAGGDEWKYYLDPSSAGMRSLMNQQIHRALVGDPSWSAVNDAGQVKDWSSGFGFDHIFFDEVWANLSQYTVKRDNSDGTLQGISTDAALRSAWNGFLASTRDAASLDGAMLGGNVEGYKDNYYNENLDMVMNETYGTDFSETGWDSENTVKSDMDRIDIDSAAGRKIILVSQGAQANTSRFRYCMALYLQVVNGDLVNFRYSNLSSYAQFWDYPEYTFPIGSPTGARALVSGTSVWRRNFSNGVALVNPHATSTFSNIQLGGTYEDTDGIQYTQVTLGPRQGVILKAV